MLSYFNGGYYDVAPAGLSSINQIATGMYSPMRGLGFAREVAPLNQQPQQSGQSPSGVFGDPFGTASSGGVQGTLQPYINKQNTNAYQSLYGGLLGYSPKDMTAGNAGGTPTTATGAQFELPSLLSNFEGFGNRSWMKG